MNFEEVLPALKAGKKVKQDGYIYYLSGNATCFVCMIDENYPDEVEMDYRLNSQEIFADDWEIVE